MKQHITKEQWNELNPEAMGDYLKVFKKKYNGGKNTPADISTELPDIGRMIEFLGDTFECIEVDDNKKNWTVFVEYNSPVKQIEFYSEVPVDCLWEAVKSKLKL